MCCGRRRPCPRRPSAGRAGRGRPHSLPRGMAITESTRVEGSRPCRSHRLVQPLPRRAAVGRVAWARGCTPAPTGRRRPPSAAGRAADDQRQVRRCTRSAAPRNPPARGGGRERERLLRPLGGDDLGLLLEHLHALPSSGGKGKRGGVSRNGISPPPAQLGAPARDVIDRVAAFGRAPRVRNVAGDTIVPSRMRSVHERPGRRASSTRPAIAGAGVVHRPVVVRAEETLEAGAHSQAREAPPTAAR